jgi:hypothetical protein
MASRPRARDAVATKSGTAIEPGCPPPDPPDPPDVELTLARITLGISLGTIGRGWTVVGWSPTKRGLTRCSAEAEGFEPSIGTDPKRD